MNTSIEPARARDDLALDDLGSGEPALVCLPGWCGGRDVFAPMADRSARYRRTVAIDWRGHGESPPAGADFGTIDLVADVVRVVEAGGIDRVVPVGQAQAGWLALELRRQLGRDRVPGVVLLSWMVLGPPPPFFDVLTDLQDPHRWEQARGQLFSLWTTGTDDPGVHRYVKAMAEHGFDMWSRAGREIAASFAAQPSPLAALEEMAAAGDACPTLHVYAQPRDEGFLTAQREYAAANPWFHVHRVDGSSHFPSLEGGAEVAEITERFVRGLG